MECVTTKNIETLKVEEKVDEPQQVVEEAPLKTSHEEVQVLKEEPKVEVREESRLCYKTV